MGVNLKICVPEATTNYILNPAIRYDTAGWNAVGSAISRTLDYARFGVASLKVVTNGAAIYEGTYYRVSSLSGISDPITVSVYVRGAGMVRIRLLDNPFGKEWTSQPITLRSDRWQRIEVTGFSTGSDDLRLYIETANRLQTATFYVDGAMMERKAYSTTYCDGDQRGCRWNVVDHNSLSTRDPYTRAGGKWVPLAGSCRPNDDIYVTVLGGFGMPPITNNIQSWALAPGSFYQNTKIQDRVVTLSFTVKKKNLHWNGKVDLNPLHKLRQELIDVIKPDRTAGGEPFLFSYNAGDREVLFWLRYEAGLEGEWDIRNQWVNSFPLRLMAVDPVFYEDNQEVASLNFLTNGGSYRAYACKNGAWGDMNYGVNDRVQCWARGRRGEIYLGGFFTRANNNALAIDPLLQVNYICYWDGVKFNAMGIGANAYINAVAVAPNGDVYVGGTFTSIGGVAANRIAKWDGSTWSALGTGVDNTVDAIAITPDGRVYISGLFATAGGLTTWSAAYWDGLAWHTMGATGGLNARAYTVVAKKDGSEVYFGGDFTDNRTDAGTDLAYVCRYDPVTNLFYPVGNGFSGSVYVLALSPSEKLYAGGGFLSSGTTSMSAIAQWNGSTWLPLGTGLNDTVWDIAITQSEQLIIRGNFTQAGGNPAYKIAFWNGSSWTNYNISAATGYDSLGLFDDVLYAGTVGRVYYAPITLVQNKGTQEVKPIVFVQGAGILRWIENVTTNKRIYFNLTIASGEDVLIDFAKGKIQSSVRGDIYYSILIGSDFADFSLTPGENKITCFMTNDVNGKMNIYHIPQHWSADATATPEELG